jgi:hypothetical protein
LTNAFSVVAAGYATVFAVPVDACFAAVVFAGVLRVLLVPERADVLRPPLEDLFVVAMGSTVAVRTDVGRY